MIVELADGLAAEFGVVQIYDDDIKTVRCYAAQLTMTVRIGIPVPAKSDLRAMRLTVPPFHYMVFEN
jgi:hypothetical protein